MFKVSSIFFAGYYLKTWSPWSVKWTGFSTTHGKFSHHFTFLHLSKRFFSNFVCCEYQVCSNFRGQRTLSNYHNQAIWLHVVLRNFYISLSLPVEWQAALMIWHLYSWAERNTIRFLWPTQHRDNGLHLVFNIQCDNLLSLVFTGDRVLVGVVNRSVK